MSLFFRNKSNKKSNDEFKTHSNNSRFATVTSKFISRLPDMGAVTEFYASKESFKKIGIKTLQEFLTAIKKTNIHDIHDALSKFITQAGTNKQQQLIINIEFDKKYLKELQLFEFVITKYNYAKNKITKINVIRNVQLTHPCIVPDRTNLYVGKVTPRPNDNILDIILTKYIDSGELPKIIIKWEPLVIDLFVNNPNTFQVNSTGNNSGKMWEILGQKFSSNDIPSKSQAKKYLKSKATKGDRKEHVKYLNDDEKAAVYLYTLNCLYKDLNAICRQRNTNEINLWKPYVVNIIRALKKLPYYWGHVYRGQEFIPPNFDQEYQKNCVVCWDAFTSASKSISFAKKWAKGQVLFKIKTWHGRWIQPLSRYNDEEEVLMMPSTYFKITKFKTNIDGLRYIVDLEEVVRPWSKQAILWVDDKPEGNKSIMESLERQGIMIIPRTTTDDAIYFLRNELPLILNRDYTNFRIITDMGRIVNSEYIANGGAKFIQSLRQKHYNHLVCVFTSNVQNATEQCKKLNLNLNSVLITTKTSELLSFAKSVLVCPCSYAESNQNDDSKSNNSNAVELKKMEVSKLYQRNGEENTRCNVCLKKVHELVYHCPQGKNNAHLDGYDVCESCVIKALRGTLKLELNVIPDNHFI